MTDNDSIRVMIKPDSISYEAVREVLFRAHQPLRDAGVVMKVPLMSAEELEEWVGKDGKCFVALDGDKVVGTAAYRFRNHNRWYWKGRLIEQTMGAVLPEYQGRHVFSRLIEIRDSQISKEDCSAVFFDTAENNIHRRQIAAKQGFKTVDYFRSNDHYSVGLVKWLDGCPYSDRYCAFRYRLKKLAVHVKHALGLYRG